MNEYESIGVQLLTPYTKAKERHEFRCLKCDHTWDATPLSIKQTHHKYGVNGCPECAKSRKEIRNTIARNAVLANLKERGIEVLSDWNGQVSSGKASVGIMINVRNTKCGHEFPVNAKNLMARGIECKVCGIAARTKNINDWSKQNSEEWNKTADIWGQYKAEVAKFTRASYKTNKVTINPTDLPFGRAGVEGSYQLDHIVPVRWCFEHYVPPKLVGDAKNLQILDWRSNLISKDKLKGELPDEFKEFETHDR